MMPLVAATLGTALANVFKSQPSSGADTAAKIATEYDTYCKAAMAPPGAPIFTGSEKTSLQGLLSAALASPEAGDPNVFAQALADGIMSYWMAPPVMFSGGPATGVTTAMTGAMSIVSPLAAALGNTQNTEDAIGQQMATLLDTATKTVMVTFSTPPPPAGPPPPAFLV